MSHRTLVNGTAYEISGGKTLVNGTAYSIKNGKTLVGGTAYGIGFGEKVTVTVVPAVNETAQVINTYDAELARVTINGVVYDGSTMVEVSVNVGTVIECYINGTTNGMITIDGTSVVSALTGTYEHTVTKNCRVAVGAYTFSLFGNTQTNAFVFVTTED